ncbi:MAG TPA: hypothetical protein VFE16_09925 [Candidatus Cybelea sp.]|jgi:hypothetical protein|nr:hypothetical protein [Candidatus Cybelea sp.]
MRHLRLAAVALLVLPPAIVAAATPSWTTATATSVTAGVTSKSTFQIVAYVTLPQQCDMSRIRTLDITSQLHRSFIVEQMPPSTTCSGKPAYKCTVMSPTFRLPIQHKFEVETKGKTWEVPLSMESPHPMEPMCGK